MGGSLNPQTSDPEFVNNPRHEFNFWFDPEAAEIVLRAPWKKIACTPTDISIKTRLTAEMVKRIEAGGTPLGRYIARYFQPGQGNDYMWDELAAAAWIDPSLITQKETRYMGVDLDRGAGYGNTLTWTRAGQAENGRPAGGDPIGSGQGKVLRNVCEADRAMGAPTPSRSLRAPDWELRNSSQIAAPRAARAQSGPLIPAPIGRAARILFALSRFSPGAGVSFGAADNALLPYADRAR